MIVYPTPLLVPNTKKTFSCFTQRGWHGYLAIAKLLEILIAQGHVTDADMTLDIATSVSNYVS